MNKRFLMILSAVVVSFILISIPAEVNAANMATAKPAIHKYNQPNLNQYKAPVKWYNSYRVKYFMSPWATWFYTGFPYVDWGFSWESNRDNGGIEIIRQIYDYEDYTHIYITNESKE
jgi:hypothetical protein